MVNVKSRPEEKKGIIRENHFYKGCVSMYKREKAVKQAWEGRANQWDERSVQMWDNGSRKEIIPFIEKHIKKGRKIMDVGCGSGYGAYKLFEAGYDVEGIDISEKMVLLAKERLKEKHIPIYQADTNDLPVEDEGFDAAMVINVLEWTSNPSESVRELKRIIKQDGMLCVGILGPTAGPRANSYRSVYGEDVIMNAMMPWEFSKLAREQGLWLVDHFGVYKSEVKESHLTGLSLPLKQALSFMWIFMLKKTGEYDGVK